MTTDTHEFPNLAIQCLWEKLQVLPAGGRMDRIFCTWVDRINGKSTNMNQWKGQTVKRISFVWKIWRVPASHLLVNLFRGFKVESLGLTSTLVADVSRRSSLSSYLCNILKGISNLAPSTMMSVAMSSDLTCICQIVCLWVSATGCLPTLYGRSRILSVFSNVCSAKSLRVTDSQNPSTKSPVLRKPWKPRYIELLAELWAQKQTIIFNHCAGNASSLLLAGYMGSHGVKIPPTQIRHYFWATHCWNMLKLSESESCHTSFSFCIALFDPPKFGVNLIIPQWTITSYCDNTRTHPQRLMPNPAAFGSSKSWQCWTVWTVH